jgi:hypothetical protein
MSIVASTKRRKWTLIVLFSVVVTYVLLLSLRSWLAEEDRGPDLSTAEAETGLSFPSSARSLKMGTVDGTLFVRFECAPSDLEGFAHNPVLLQNNASSVANSMNDEPRLPWWKPSRARVFRFWSLVEDGDGIQVLIDQTDPRRAVIWIHRFEV